MQLAPVAGLIMNIVEPILFQAKFRPEAPALCAQGIDVVSYARLAAQMNNVARRALGYGLTRGSVVALSVEDPMLHAALILGLTQAGIVPVSVAAQKPPAGLKLDAVLSSTAYPFAPEAKHFIIDHWWITGDGRPGEIAADGGQICRIILTAGSTGDSKAVALTHKMVAQRNARLDHVVGDRIPLCSRLYMQMGLAAALGYQFLTYMLARGGTLFFRGDNIENTLRSFEIFQIQTMLATPTTLAQFLVGCDHHPAVDVHLDTIVSGGSLLPQALLERVRPRLCTHLVTGYGSTETAISATAPAQRIAHIEGAAGYVTPGIRIEIVDAADRPLPAGTEGIVRIASEFGVDRYIDDPAESAQMFRDGWFYPGDLGSLAADNLLIISGRLNSVLNAGGGKMAAERVETVLTSYKGVSQAAVFMATSQAGVEEVWAALVCSAKIDVARLQAHCRPHMPAIFVPAHVVVLDALPINAMGKIDRPRLKETVLSSARS